MSKGSSPPPAPDPYATADAQQKMDQKTLQYALNNSRTSTVNPFGQTGWANNRAFDQAGFDAAMASYKPKMITTGRQYNADSDTYTGGTEVVDPTFNQSAPQRSDFERDSWTNTQTLSPDSQSIYDTSTAKLKEATGNISTDVGAYDQQAADTVYQMLRRYQDPADERARSSMQSNLADRGFQVGNEGYNTEMTRLDDSQGQGRAQAAGQAQLTGFAQGQQKLSMQQQIAQMLQGLRGAQVAGVSGMPSTTTTPSIAAPDLMGMINTNYQNALQANAAENASGDQLLSSILQMGGMALGGPLGGSMGALLGKGVSSGGYNGGNTSRDFFMRR